RLRSRQRSTILDASRPGNPTNPGRARLEGALHTRITSAPFVHDDARASRVLAELVQRCAAESDLAVLGGLVGESRVGALLAGIFGDSPYLTSLIERSPSRLAAALLEAPEERFATLVRNVEAAVAAARAMPAAMEALRRFKTDVALL